MFESPAPKFIPTWLSHGGSNRFLNTDTWLHDAEIRARAKPDKDLNDIYVMGSSSDFGVKMFRKVS